MDEPGADGKGRRALLRALTVGGASAVAGVAMGAAIDDADASTRIPASAPGTPPGAHWRPPAGHVDVFWAVNTQQKVVALTFDDGPLPNYTPLVHDALDEAKIPATFFLVGKRVEQHARLLHGRMDRHEVGNHTWAHTNLSPLSLNTAYRSVKRAHEMIVRVTGKEPRLLRPPWGQLGGTTLQVAGRLGYDVALWSLLITDRSHPHDPKGLIDFVVDSALPGSIVLGHDAGGGRSRLTLARALPEMIKRLKTKGFEFVTVSDLIAAKAAPASRGT
ncbi:polysaccharide deacetylase family protein [Actinoallomurus sp. NPDC050550]|uniref:polysaccharide deacetylase family protein n=1 Tax=Actinoallomurus sp. NPDC050550 TaxID=3154937 RepID=UPI003406CD73